MDKKQTTPCNKAPKPKGKQRMKRRQLKMTAMAICRFKNRQNYPATLTSSRKKYQLIQIKLLYIIKKANTKNRYHETVVPIFCPKAKLIINIFKNKGDFQK